MKGLTQLFKKLDTIIELLLRDQETKQAEKEEKQRAENERLLVEYAKERGKRQPTGGVWSSRAAADAPVHSDGDLIPYNLSERDKAILDEFYNGPR